MKKENIHLLLIIIAALLMCCAGCKNPGHACRWKLCPYKGVTDAPEAVAAYTQCEPGTDGYEIDILHIEYPDLDADQLDSLLTSPMKY